MGSAAACGGDDGEGNGADPDAGSVFSSSSSSGDNTSSSSGGSTSSSSGGSTSSSSGGSTSSSSSGGTDAGTDAAVCNDPIPPIFGPPDVSCGVYPNGSEANMVVYEALVGTPTYTGGTILPGTYQAVKAETNLTENTPDGTNSVWVLDAEGAMTRIFADYNVPEFGGNDITLYGRGSYGVAGTTLTLIFNECKNGVQPPTEQRSYSVRSEGCDDFLEIGTATSRTTLKRLRIAVLEP